VVKHPPKARGEWQPRGDLDDLYRLVRVGSASARAEEVPRPATEGRWVAERTIGWLSQSRRMSKDYERSCESSQAVIYAVMSRLMLRRLARA
jgi:hypothetical protein